MVLTEKNEHFTYCSQTFGESRKTALTEKSEICVVMAVPGRITITEVLLAFPL